MVSEGGNASVGDLDYPAETDVFGCHPFANASSGPTWSEASSRLIYVAHNFRRLDTGSLPHFGSVGVIFRTSAVASLVEIAPIDTGIWEGSCNHSRSGPRLNLDCSSTVLPPVGTLEHLDHLLLSGLRLWAGKGAAGPIPTTTVGQQASELFARSAWTALRYESLPAIGTWEPAKYWEANLVGNPQFPADVRFLLPLFGSLWGTQSGDLARKLADKHRWPLVWALGDATNGTAGRHASHSMPSAANGRLLDPLVRATARLNVSLPAQSSAVFSRVWGEAAALRQRVGGQPSVESVRGWWRQLLPATVRLAPTSAVACADADRCIGVDVAALRCVCEL
jgi:hypothetical protein